MKLGWMAIGPMGENSSVFPSGRTAVPAPHPRHRRTARPEAIGRHAPPGLDGPGPRGAPMAYVETKPTNGRHFLQIPGPTNVPDRVLRAMDNPTMDHRGPEFGRFGKALLEKLRTVFRTASPVVVYPASGTGAWEAALANTLSPGDRVLMSETGWFATLWREMAERLTLRPEFLPGDWRRGADPARIEARLREDKERAIKAVCVVHNETSTGATSRIDEVRRAMDAAGHPALLLVDTISSLGSIDYRHDERGVDVPVPGSQKGLLLPRSEEHTSELQSRPYLVCRLVL